MRSNSTSGVTTSTSGVTDVKTGGKKKLTSGA